MPTINKYSDLTFASEGLDWEPVRTGDYATDCATGRRYARELIDFMSVTDDPLPFGRAVRAITAGGVYEAVEIGFCSTLGFVLAGISAPVASR